MIFKSRFSGSTEGNLWSMTFVLARKFKTRELGRFVLGMPELITGGTINDILHFLLACRRWI